MSEETRETVNRPALYTEKSTDVIYEVQLFEKFAVIRPVAPGFEDAISRVTLRQLGEDFEEFSGVHEAVYAYIDGRMEGELCTKQLP